MQSIFFNTLSKESTNNKNLSFNQLGMRDFFLIAINPPSASWINCAGNHVTKKTSEVFAKHPAGARLPKSKFILIHHQGFG
jgi:hypothetical protein